jgi:hypothetical protein
VFHVKKLFKKFEKCLTTNIFLCKKLFGKFEDNGPIISYLNFKWKDERLIQKQGKYRKQGGKSHGKTVKIDPTMVVSGSEKP